MAVCGCRSHRLSKCVQLRVKPVLPQFEQSWQGCLRPSTFHAIMMNQLVETGDIYYIIAVRNRHRYQTIGHHRREEEPCVVLACGSLTEVRRIRSRC
jgi:hypothetical protein